MSMPLTGLGASREILYDHPKTIVLGRDLTGRQHVEPAVLGLHPVLWVSSPAVLALSRPHEGKVESGVKYVKRAFLLGRTCRSWEDLNAQGRDWVRTVADQRVHGTTFRKPAEAFLEATPCPRRTARYVLQISLLRTVARDCLVTVETNRY